MRDRVEGILALVLIAAAVPAWAAGTTTRVSISSSGAQSNGDSTHPAVSANGRFVAFVSAGNLVPTDTNGAQDVYVRDRKLNLTERVSISSSGAQGDGDSGRFGSSGTTPVAISADGRFVAFVSNAKNLVAHDTNLVPDVFIRDRKNGLTSRVSVASNESEATNQSTSVSISANGQLVAFQSLADNLVTGDTNSTDDVFVRDQAAGTTQRVSVSSGGTQGDAASLFPKISADGQFVAFASAASTFVPGNMIGRTDVLVRDRVARKTTRVSIATGGSQGDSDSGREGLAISANGRYVAFSSDAENLVLGDANLDTDIFVRDRATGTTTRASIATGGAEADGFSFLPSISSDGRFVAFGSWADNLATNGANGVPDVFVRDRQTGTTTLMSAAVDGSRSNRHNGQNGVAISADSHFVAFQSFAGNLVLGDTNNLSDVFARDR